MNLPGISIIICTYNGRSRLEKVLLALQNQINLQSIPVEVILVDNASTDGTADFARQMWTSTTMELCIIREERPGVAVARETGQHASRYDLICWVDDDNILSPDYLSLAFELMHRYPFAAICGGHGRPVGPEGPVTKPAWIPQGWGSHGCGLQGETEGPLFANRKYVYGAGAILRRQALQELAEVGFRPLLKGRAGANLVPGEDSELCFAVAFLGWLIIQSPRLTFDHLVPPHRFSWDYCLRLFQGFAHASVSHTLYSVFLETGLGSPLKQSWPGILIILFYNRWKAFRCRLQPEREYDPESIKRATILARTEEFNRLYAEGTLKAHYLQVREFRRRSASYRQQRQATIR